MFNLLIKGFRSKAEVEAFIDWYVEQGEQDAGNWFEEVQTEEIRDFIGCDAKKTYPLNVEGNTVTMYLEEE